MTLVAGPNASANFDSPDTGSNKGISYSGYTLGGADAGLYALAINCCGPELAHTTGTITAATTPPPVTPPPVTPPPVTPPPVTPPPVTPPPVTPPTTPPTTTTTLGVIPPLPPLPLPPPETLVTVAPETLPPLVMDVTQVAPPEEDETYVAPVRKPKPYRN